MGTGQRAPRQGSVPWKRLEVPVSLYRELERDARVVGMSTQAYAATLIGRGLKQDREAGNVSFRDRVGVPTGSPGGEWFPAASPAVQQPELPLVEGE